VQLATAFVDGATHSHGEAAANPVQLDVACQWCSASSALRTLTHLVCIVCSLQEQCGCSSGREQHRCVWRVASLRPGAPGTPASL
jgi:hypothetical protein